MIGCTVTATTSNDPRAGACAAVGRSRAAEEGEAAKPPAPDDRFLFLTGPKKGQVVRADDLALGGAQRQMEVHNAS